MPDDLTFGDWVEVSLLDVPAGKVRIMQSKAISAAWSCHIAQTSAGPPGVWAPSPPFKIPTQSALRSDKSVDGWASCVEDGVFDSDGAKFFTHLDDWGGSGRRLAVGVLPRPDLKLIVEGNPDIRQYSANVGVFLEVDRETLDYADSWIDCQRTAELQASCTATTDEITDD